MRLVSEPSAQGCCSSCSCSSSSSGGGGAETSCCRRQSAFLMAWKSHRTWGDDSRGRNYTSEAILSDLFIQRKLCMAAVIYLTVTIFIQLPLIQLPLMQLPLMQLPPIQLPPIQLPPIQLLPPLLQSLCRFATAYSSVSATPSGDLQPTSFPR